jgi:hypothetical protein
LGFVPRSSTILCRPVPSLTVAIRNFSHRLYAVPPLAHTVFKGGREVERSPAHSG